jgi:hypothetical protein
MKNILILLFLSLFLGYSCKFFKKSAPRAVDTTSSDTVNAASGIADTTANYAGVDNTTVPAAASTPAKKASGGVTSGAHGKYYMIVGCFTVQKNADNYASKMKTMGYDGQIIQGRDNFQMVAARSYDNYRASIAEIDKFRNDVTPNAWVYREK